VEHGPRGRCASERWTGIGIQLDSLRQLLITLPVPSIAGIQLEQLSIGADSGYVMMSGQIH
jgi:hypothetical protein